MNQSREVWGLCRGALVGVLALLFVAGWSVQVSLPGVALQNVPVSFKVESAPANSRVSLQVFTETGEQVWQGAFTVPDSGMLETEIRLPQTGRLSYRWEVAGETGAGQVRVLPAWWSLLPALVAIALALALREVVLALFGGIWLGAWMVYGGNPFAAFLRVVDTYLLNAYADRDHLHIVLFSLLLGGMIGLITRAGGLKAIVRTASRWVRSATRAQWMTFLLGLAIFFDDYANTLFVGSTMRPLTDRFRISREKLAYLIDSTSAPVANLALISTWIGFEVSVIAESFQASGVRLEPYWAFLVSLPYRFYPIFALVLIVWLILLRRDFGAMHRAEMRARTTGKVLADTASPLADYESRDLLPDAHQHGNLWVALVPLLTAIGGTLWGLISTGVSGLGEGEPLTLRGILANANSYQSLLWGSALGCAVAFVLAVANRALTMRTAFHAWLGGMRTMFLAVVILGLAWGIGAVCSDLHTARYLVQTLEGSLSPMWLPALTTLVAAGISFATGSSWATMSILMPLVIPLSAGLTRSLGAEEQTFYLIASLSSVMAGAIFGDHCSPISDTTVLSSIFSGSDHIDHVRTQIPYALVTMGVAWLLGDVATGFGFPVWLALGLGTIVLGLIVRFVGKPVPEAADASLGESPQHAASERA